MAVKIRKMLIEDYEEVYKLWFSCTGMGLNNLDDSKEGIEKFLKRNPDTCFVAEDSEIIGVILAGNAFWEKQGFSVRNDLIYRNKALADIVRIDT